MSDSSGIKLLSEPVSSPGKGAQSSLSPKAVRGGFSEMREGKRSAQGSVCGPYSINVRYY